MISFLDHRLFKKSADVEMYSRTHVAFNFILDNGNACSRLLCREDSPAIDSNCP